MEDTDAQSGTIANSEEEVCIGAFCNGATVGFYLTAIIDDVRIYNYARDAAQIQRDYLETYKNKFVGGKVGGAMEFDGVDDYVDFNSITIDKDSGTISVWFKTSADFTGNYGGRGHMLGNNNKYQSYLGLYDDGTAPYSLIGETNLNEEYYVKKFDIIPVGVWNFVASSFDNGNVKTYLNGALIYSATVENNLTLSQIGAGLSGAGNTPFNGLIDDVRIYNYARSPLQIQLDYNEGFATRL